MTENGKKYEIEPLVLEDDSLIEIAQKAEQRIEAVKQIKNIVLKITNPRDWTNQNDRPYLGGSGCHKVATVFGIGWTFLGDPIKVREEDGHFRYDTKLSVFMRGRITEVMGSRTSKDPFFTTRYRDGKQIELPPSEVDSGDVLKASITNAQANGISAILGIKNLAWEDLEKGGIKKSEVTEIQYKKKGESPKQNGGSQIKDPDSPATEGQIKAIHAILGGLGIKDDHAKCEKVTIIIMGEGKLPIPHISSESITKGQASKVIDTLNKEKK